MLYQALGLSQKLEQSLFWVDERVFPTIIDWRTNAPKDGMPAENTYSVEAVRSLDTHRTPIPKQPEILMCLVRISRRYYLRDKVYPTFLHDDDRDMDLFNLIRAPNPIKVKIRSRPRAAHKVPLLTLTANQVVKMEELVAATDSSGVPSTIKRSPFDFANEAGASDQGTMALEVPHPEDVPATSAPKACQAEKVLRRDHVDPRPTGSTHGGKSLTAIELGLASTRPVHVPENAPAGVSDPYPLSFVDPQSSKGTAVAGDPDSGNASFAFVVGYPESIYRPEWGVANGSMLDTPKACQNLVDHVAHSGYFSKLRHLHNDDFLRQDNMNIARQVAMGSQLRRRLPPYKSRSVGRRSKRLPLKSLSGMKTVGWSSDAQRWMRAWIRSEMDALGCHRGSPICNGTRAAPCRDEIRKSLELRQAFADVVSVGIATGMSEGLGHGVEHGQAQLSLESIEAYDLEAEAKYVAALQASKDLKYPLVDQLVGLKDAPMDVILAALSDGVPVSVPTVVPQGLAILLADAATQMELEEAT
nr:hypothetical protein [Tanacetum cinerariifolium]